MANVKKGNLTGPHQWWKHLDWWKRVFWKGERQAHKRKISNDMKDLDRAYRDDLAHGRDD